MTLFSELDLIEPILKTVEAQGFTEPTAIQAAAIPAQLAGRDVMGIAQTGGGKTAAFALPLLQKLAQAPARRVACTPRALILAPTRELARQIGDCLYTFSKGLKLRHTVVYGGAPFHFQVQSLQRGVDILVATPGRLLDHMRRNTVRLSMAEMLILDEADRMLDLGFVDDVTQIANALSADRQTVMFSATMSRAVTRLAHNLLNEPERVEVAREATVAASVDHRVLFVKRHNKRPLLKTLLEGEAVERVLVFTRTKADADELARELEDDGLRADAIHGDKPQRVRQRTLQSFRNGRFNVLVATDVAARGIDVPGITHVINYDIPLEPESYVHRVGRTGRAGARGTAISLCDGGEKRLLRNIERVIDQPVRVDADHPFHVSFSDRPPRARAGRPGGRPGGRGQGKFIARKGRRDDRPAKAYRAG